MLANDRDEVEKKLTETLAELDELRRARHENISQIEAVARQRQDDLMIITHQLQGPLSSAVGTVSEMKHAASNRDWEQIVRGLEDIGDTLEDAMLLCYMIVTTLAHEIGRPSAFSEDLIDAPRELELMAHRIRKAYRRLDLSFQFLVEHEFPLLKMDKNIFKSVFYALLHNAMKYADDHSIIIIECRRELSTGRSAIKLATIGEPISPTEVETIFEKYERGAVIKSTGRHHSGVGIGLWTARQLLAAVGATIRVELAPTEPRLSSFVVVQ